MSPTKDPIGPKTYSDTKTCEQCGGSWSINYSDLKIGISFVIIFFFPKAYATCIFCGYNRSVIVPYYVQKQLIEDQSKEVGIFQFLKRIYIKIWPWP